MCSVCDILCNVKQDNAFKYASYSPFKIGYFNFILLYTAYYSTRDKRHYFYDVNPGILFILKVLKARFLSAFYLKPKTIIKLWPKMESPWYSKGDNWLLTWFKGDNST